MSENEKYPIIALEYENELLHRLTKATAGTYSSFDAAAESILVLMEEYGRYKYVEGKRDAFYETSSYIRRLASENFFTFVSGPQDFSHSKEDTEKAVFYRDLWRYFKEEHRKCFVVADSAEFRRWHKNEGE